MKKYMSIFFAIILLVLSGCGAAQTDGQTTQSADAPKSTATAAGYTYARPTPSPSPEPAMRFVAETLTDMRDIIFSNENLILAEEGATFRLIKNDMQIYKTQLIDEDYYFIARVQDSNLVQLRLYIFDKTGENQWTLKARLTGKDGMNAGPQSILYQIISADLPDCTIIFGLVGELYVYTDDPNEQDITKMHEEDNLRVTKMVVSVADQKAVTLDTADDWGYIIVAERGERIKELSVYAGTRELTRAKVRNYVVPYPYLNSDAEVIQYK